jgi:gamma-glutamylcyclotransferase
MDDRTYGVLYNLEEHEMAVLDSFENAGVEYHNRPVEVVTSGGPVLARCYFAFSRTIDDSLAPYDWYMQHVLDGAVERGLPDAYVKQLQAVKCIPDPRRAEFLLAKG